MTQKFKTDESGFQFLINYESPNDIRKETLNSLIDMFPLIPENLFEPLLDLDNSDMSDAVMIMISKEDNIDIMTYLMEFKKNCESNSNSDNDSLSLVNQESGVMEIPTPDDDKTLANLEVENEKGLVLGRTFLKEAHKVFASKFSLEYVNIDDIPPEITEMNWQIPEKLKLQIYCSFFEELGLIESKNESLKQTDKIINKPDDNMTMREIIELEKALEKSMEIQKKKINNNTELLLQIESLKMKYPQISREELENVFISCNMDTRETISELSKVGHSSQNKVQMSNNDKTNNDKTKSTVDQVTNAVRVQRIGKRIEIEKNKLAHIKTKINLTKTNGLHAEVRGYWMEELSRCKQRILWYQEQSALASVAQQSLVFGNRQLDLHGFTCASALVAVESRIGELSSSSSVGNQDNHLIIICGRGLHSLRGRARLKPAVQNFLISRNIKFTQPFDGTFRVGLQQLRKRGS